MFFLRRLIQPLIKSLSCNGRRSVSFLFDAFNSEVVVENTKNNKKILTLNRPESLNAINLDMIRALTKELKSVQMNPSVCDLILLKGAGTKAFCAGGDVKAVSKSYMQKTSIYKDFFYEEYQLNYLIGTLKVPFVALMDGITMGGGCGVSVNGKFRVATERTILAMPETSLGLFPDCGGTYFLSRLRGKLGLFLGLTGHRLHGVDVYHSGLATHYIESSNLGVLTQALLNLRSENCNIAGVKELLDGHHSSDESAPFSLEPFVKEIDDCFNANNLEEIIRNLENSDTEFAKSQLARLYKMSPTSLKITFRQLSEGTALKFAEAIPIEYRIVRRCLNNADFHEGCRAVLIDKDHKPKWNPSRIEHVSDEKVNEYFTPFENNWDELIVR